MTNQLYAEVVLKRWSGHGDGGTIARVVIRGGDYGIYESTPEQIAQANADAARVNAALQSSAEPPADSTPLERAFAKEPERSIVDKALRRLADKL